MLRSTRAGGFPPRVGRGRRGEEGCSERGGGDVGGGGCAADQRNFNIFHRFFPTASSPRPHVLFLFLHTPQDHIAILLPPSIPEHGHQLVSFAAPSYPLCTVIIIPARYPVHLRARVRGRGGVCAVSFLGGGLPVSGRDRYRDGRRRRVVSDPGGPPAAEGRTPRGVHHGGESASINSQKKSIIEIFSPLSTLWIVLQPFHKWSNKTSNARREGRRG